MTTLPLSYIHRFRDRHGKMRHYFRKPGHKQVSLPGMPGSKEFMAAYQAALAGKPMEIAAERTKPGTFNALIVSYYQSADWLQLKPITQATYRNLIERLRTQHGDNLITLLEAKHVRNIVAKKAATPASGNALLKMLRILMRHAIEMGWRKDDPTQYVRKLKNTTEGHQSWSEDDIARFRSHWPVGSSARLAFELLLYTGQRSADVRVMGWQHTRNGKIDVKQSKTGARLLIPVHPSLAEVLNHVPAGQMTFLLTGQGKTFSAGGFGNYFRDCRRAAGLPEGLSAHGLRKAAARRLAEAGCSLPEIMAIGGWKTPKEATGYIRAASQEHMADKAIASLLERKQ
ncbi:MAG: tyrosine-type recombinase/integrase [Acetobacter sp.]|nr:tyrosine-type recombinase/integrase [Acetobacter sp.]